MQQELTDEHISQSRMTYKSRVADTDTRRSAHYDASLSTDPPVLGTGQHSTPEWVSPCNSQNVSSAFAYIIDRLFVIV